MLSSFHTSTSLSQSLDPVQIAADLIRCPSVTPEEGGAIDLLQSLLESMEFICHRLYFEEYGTDKIENLYARRGNTAPHFCFAGHSDVVPVDDVTSWSVRPFDGIIAKDHLWGRGAVDMKGAIAAFIAAVDKYLVYGGNKGSISLLITGDEESQGINGTIKVLNWMEANGEIPDMCILGEPTNHTVMGDTIKIGRRGSFTGHITLRGIQGHVAYPDLTQNPVHQLIRIFTPFINDNLDQGTIHFAPSNLSITTIDVGNLANNVIPAKAHATFNVRFNDNHSSESLNLMFRKFFDNQNVSYTLKTECLRESFLTEPGILSKLISDATFIITGRRPELSTNGGTSDANFIKRLCPVVEFGLVGKTMHQVDEHVPLADIYTLKDIYLTVLKCILG
ncbi:succinyl-diaminopimelate desuccinylase [Candidatus Endolissoclinum faulkneri L5]|uniref:Succinyl-diaminopimelate desuccinylase n=1 Tax=Candidatus Endolissoclinum faulkneri L5 TaxID=1401328 RepID=V9TVM9_9PROT|nr:succinyl-diaminopimelate desuccinylase [Candidatus Endolissoclinum faulkneri]AHC73748.1 succinyl-diaminopimelate desuccinylase [Candidatus Endolissoclinum faulkneri L5]